MGKQDPVAADGDGVVVELGRHGRKIDILTVFKILDGIGIFQVFRCFDVKGVLNIFTVVKIVSTAIFVIIAVHVDARVFQRSPFEFCFRFIYFCRITKTEIFYERNVVLPAVRFIENMVLLATQSHATETVLAIAAVNQIG